MIKIEIFIFVIVLLYFEFFVNLTSKKQLKSNLKIACLLNHSFNDLYFILFVLINLIVH